MSYLILLPMLLLVGLLVAFVVFLRRRGGATFRRACFKMGLLLYAVLFFSTYLDTRVVDRSPPPHEGMLHLPTLDVVAAAGADGSSGRRLLIHIVRVGRLPALPSDILDVQEIDFRWPASKKNWERTAATPTGSSLVEFQILQATLPPGTDSPTPIVGTELDFLLSVDGKTSQRETMSLPDSKPVLRVKGPRNSNGFERYFTSFVPRRIRSATPVVVVARWVADDDPLQPVSLTRFLERTPILETLQRIPRRTYTDLNDLPPGGLQWFIHAGVAGLLLLVAAMLVAQRFENPAVAFAALSLVAVLSAISLERLRVGRCGSVLGNPQATWGEKAAALEGLETVFFFSWSAERFANEVAANEDTPANFRRWSQRVARTLHRRNLE